MRTTRIGPAGRLALASLVTLCLGPAGHAHRYGYAPLLGRGDGPADLVLIYQGGVDRLAWSAEQLQHYVTYRDPRSGRERWLFDGFLFLEFRDGRGATYTSERKLRSANRSDWTWLGDRLFSRGVALDALDKVIASSAARIGEPARPRAVFIGLPEPIIHQKDWGELNGRALDFDRPEDRLAATTWYVNEVLRRWRSRAPAHLVLRGFYWVAEDSSQSKVLLPRVVDLIHRQGMELVWIPYWKSPQLENWRSLGFDRAYLQPNHFFKLAVPESRLDEACEKARALGMGLEVEFDGRALSDEAFRPRMSAYFARFRARGALASAPLAWYEGGGAILGMAVSRVPALRRLYDDLASIVIARQTTSDARFRARRTRGHDRSDGHRSGTR